MRDNVLIIQGNTKKGSNWFYRGIISLCKVCYFPLLTDKERRRDKIISGPFLFMCTNY